MSAVLGLLAVFVLTAATGYFVAQEFAYVSVDRLTLSTQAAAGDKKAAKAIEVTERLSFMLSGAQLDGLGRLLVRSEEHTSELQSRENLVCRLLLEKKKRIKNIM